MNKVVSIVITVLLLIFGIGGAIFVHLTMTNTASAEPSNLADINQEIKSKTKDLKTIISQSEKAVVQIKNKADGGDLLGSGFLFDDKGDIITNGHVVAGADKVTVKMADSTIYDGTVIGKSADIDVALIRVAALAGKTPLVIAKDKTCEIGDEVVALGSPLGLQNSATTGIISGVNRDFSIDQYKYSGVYQISAPIAPGNSGGPLLDKKTGEVVGINSAKVGDETIGFSIPIAKVLTMVEGWVNHPVTTSVTDSAAKPASQVSQSDAEQLIRDFYDNLNNQNYVAAYAMMGSDWQGQTTYEKFRDGYLNTVSVQIQSITSSVQTAGTIQVMAIIEATERVDGGTQLTDYKLTYTVGTENGQIEILSGQSQAI